MNPIALVLLWAAAKSAGPSSGSKPDQVISAYKIPKYNLHVIDLGTGGLSLVVGDDAGFVTDGSKVLTVRYGGADKAAAHVPHLKETTPQEPAWAKFYGGPNAVVVKSSKGITLVFDADNIATVDRGKFLGKCLQGTVQTCSALISKILAAGIDLETTVVGRDYVLHHGRVPAKAHSWREVIHFLNQ